MLPGETPDLAALEMLCSVGELGSLGRVARERRISQPAVSMRLRNLEGRLGLTLLQRGPSGTRLTPAGERVAAASRRVLGEVGALLATVGSARAEAGARLRLAASLTVAASLLPEWIETLRAAEPSLSLSLEVANSAVVLERVSAGMADMGFVEGREHSEHGLESLTVRDDRLVLVVSPEHPWARRRQPVRGEELARSELLVREEGSGTREVLEEALRAWGGVSSRLELGSIDTILGAVRRGRAPTVLSRLSVAEHLAAGSLVEVATDGVQLTRRFRALWLAERRLPPLAQHLLELART